jgi:hypothetical protein
VVETAEDGLQPISGGSTDLGTDLFLLRLEVSGQEPAATWGRHGAVWPATIVSPR